MNYAMIRYIMAILMETEAGLLALPLGVSLYYGDGHAMAFVLPMLLLALPGTLGVLKKPKNTVIFAREGYIVVSISWVLMSLIGALPFVLSGSIPNYIDAFFETVSGFTTTGASILRNVELLPRSMLFWRSFTHWIGGMGVLVFIMAIVPLAGGRSLHLMRAESPGPSVGKITSKVRSTAFTLYAIYGGISALEVIFLLFGGMPLFDSLIHTFGSVGTGGFGMYADSIAHYNSTYIDIVISVFMLICGINFNIYFLILTRQFATAYKSEELRWYLGIVAAATVVIALNILHLFGNFFESLRYSFFQVSSVITTTGFATADFDRWPELSRVILVSLMFLGASAGSTGGGLKISRFVILLKSAQRAIRRALHPNATQLVYFEGRPVDESVVTGVNTYFILFCLLQVISVLLISINGFDFTSTVTSVIACFNNIGPGLSLVGPMGGYADFSAFSKLILSLDMVFGRLEILPMLMLFAPGAWRIHRNKKGGRK